MNKGEALVNSVIYAVIMIAAFKHYKTMSRWDKVAKQLQKQLEEYDK